MSFFSKFINSIKSKTYYILGGGTNSKPRSRLVEDNEICSAIIDCNATHIARGEVLHIVEDLNGRIKFVKRDSPYTRLFRKPNPMMSRQDFLYSMAWQLQVTNTSYAWIKWDAAMQPIEIWPLVYLNFELRERTDGGYAVLFIDTGGQRRIVKTEDLIVLRRKYDAAGFAGRSNNEIDETLDMTNSLDEGLKQALNISNKIHGILKNKKAMLSIDKDPEETKNRIKNAAEHGGILELDAMEDYVPLDPKTWAANAAQVKQITDRIYTFWRTPEEVVKNTASEQVMQNYYDSIIEFVWEEMSDAFTDALFTKREQGFGNRMIVTSSATTGASWNTKLSIVRDTKEQGLLTTNEYRELLGYGPVEDGDERLVSLNYIKSTDQSKYQTGKEGEEDGKKSEKTDE